MKQLLHGALLGFLLFNATLVDAACGWRWDCTTGACVQVPICASPIDIVPARPVEVAPVPGYSIKPIVPSQLPPVGTRQCEQRRICSGYSCNWQMVCR